MAGRVSAVRDAVSRATVLPFLLRCGIALCGVIAMSVAWPTQFMTSQYSTLIVLAAIYPAIAPRGRGATVSALMVVAGWLIDTAGFNAPVTLGRVLTIATMLYIGHSLTALAAQLPFDAVVNLDVPGLWLVRTLAVVLVSAVLTVVALGLSADLAGDPFLAATLVGLAGAVGATLLLARLLRRA